MKGKVTQPVSMEHPMMCESNLWDLCQVWDIICIQTTDILQCHLLNHYYLKAPTLQVLYEEIRSIYPKVQDDRIKNMKFCYLLKVCQNRSLTLVNMRRHQCSEIFCNYNLHMDGVNLSDMRCYMFLDEHRTIKWNTKIFSHYLVEYYYLTV